jgi:hypothetical protein
MKAFIIQSFILAGGVFLLAGCITHEETVYRDVPRRTVEFENDRAARIFYEALDNKAVKQGRAESKTEVDVPIVFHDKRRVVDGPNAAFNKAVEQCDTNGDGRITVQEAEIFAQNRH